MTFGLDLKLSFDWGRKSHTTKKFNHGVAFTTDKCTLILECGRSIDLQIK